MEVLRKMQALAVRPERGWMRAVRTSLGLSQTHVAARASMTRQAYADLEAAEERGAISLNSLRRAAEAMDADFAYYVVPRAEAMETPSLDSGTEPDDGELPVELR
jgi:predicted DNA-binding mobile mystery protein A